MVEYSVRLVLSFKEAGHAIDLDRILIADFVQIPEGLTFKQEVKREQLVLYVCDKNLNRVRSTLDEILGQCELVLKLEEGLKVKRL